MKRTRVDYLSPCRSPAAKLRVIAGRDLCNRPSGVIKMHVQALSIRACGLMTSIHPGKRRLFLRNASRETLLSTRLNDGDGGYQLDGIDDLLPFQAPSALETRLQADRMGGAGRLFYGILNGLPSGNFLIIILVTPFSGPALSNSRALNLQSSVLQACFPDRKGCSTYARSSHSRYAICSSEVDDSSSRSPSVLC